VRLVIGVAGVRDKVRLHLRDGKPVDADLSAGRPAGGGS
jgi:hypothetical protein